MYQSEGFPERDILSLCVIPPWDLPGWESCWAAAAVAVAVGVTWYQYYQYAQVSDITRHPKFKVDSLGEKKPLRAVTRQTKLIYNGYPDGFIQCIHSWIP